MSGATRDTSIHALAPAKLNLFLHVTGRRSDGYHTLQSLFVLIDRADGLQFNLRDDGLIQRSNDIDGVDASADLTLRAASALQRASGSRFGADIAIDKRIPMGGGLGGGSSDAASALLTLNRLWGLDWPHEQLARIGLSLGADVPFFLFGRNAVAEGVGEVLTPIEVPDWWYTVLTPAAHVPTPMVFAHPDLTRNTPPLKIADFSADALAGCKNDLQDVVLKAFPAVHQALDALACVAQRSVFGARMTGSGACVFAAFHGERDAREALKNVSPEIPGFVARGLACHPVVS
jgi:4-diphosphocytidyl-2-C-methyl-D-erythritol kinase